MKKTDMEIGISPSSEAVKEEMNEVETPPQEVHITEESYEQVLCGLIEEIGGYDYFSGHIDFEQDSVECRLVVSAVVYREERSRPECPEYRYLEITDLVPVWWECHSSFEGVSDVPNDFSFSELRRKLKRPF